VQRAVLQLYSGLKQVKRIYKNYKQMRKGWVNPI